MPISDREMRALVRAKKAAAPKKKKAASPKKKSASATSSSSVLAAITKAAKAVKKSVATKKGKGSSSRSSSDPYLMKWSGASKKKKASSYDSEKAKKYRKYLMKYSGATKKKAADPYLMKWSGATKKKGKKAAPKKKKDGSSRSRSSTATSELFRRCLALAPKQRVAAKTVARNAGARLKKTSSKNGSSSCGSLMRSKVGKYAVEHGVEQAAKEYPAKTAVRRSRKLQRECNKMPSADVQKIARHSDVKYRKKNGEFKKSSTICSSLSRSSSGLRRLKKYFAKHK